MLCLPSDWGETCAAAATDGAGLSGKEAGRDLRAGGKKITACFR
jgi:hypothetical protein